MDKAPVDLREVGKVVAARNDEPDEARAAPPWLASPLRSASLRDDPEGHVMPFVSALLVNLLV